MSRAERLDHLPDLLDVLADRLRGEKSDATSTGREHGRHRWLQGYDLGEVVQELGHLRATLGRATAAFAEELGEKPMTGMLIAGLAVGSMISGIGWGAVHWRLPLRHRLAGAVAITPYLLMVWDVVGINDNTWPAIGVGTLFTGLLLLLVHQAEARRAVMRR